MATTNTVTAAGELLSSIAAVRQLLLQNHHQPSHKYADDLSMVQQSRYEDRLKFEEEQKSQKELLDDLTVRLEQARHEAQQEKAIRESLEATNEALEKHKEELSVQLETLSSSRPSLFESQEHDSIPLASVQALEQEKNDLVAKWTYSQKEIAEIKVTSDKWRSQCLASQRQVKELQIQLETFKKEYQMSQDRHKELLQGGDTKYESFHRRLEESVAARKKAEQELQAIIRKSSSTADSNVSQKASSQSQEPSREEQQQKLIEVTQKCDEADKARVAAEDKVHRLELELEALKRGKVEEEMDQEREAQVKVGSKITSLNESLEKMQTQVQTLTKEVNELDKTQKPEKSKEKNEELSLSLTKWGALLECMESQLKEKLVLFKTKADDHSSELKRVRQELSIAKTAVTAVQSKIIQCQQEQKKLAKTIEQTTTKASMAAKITDTTTHSDDLVPIAESAAKSRASPKKRVPSDNKGTATKRPKKTKK